MSGIIIVGGGEHAAVVADVCMSAGKTVRGFLDDDSSCKASISMGLPWLGKISTLDTENHDTSLVMGIGSNDYRYKIAFQLEELGFKFVSVIHPSATVSKTASLGDGTVVMPRAVVNTNAVVGRHCIINSAAVVEHDSQIGDGAHISVGTILAGRVTVGCRTLIGAGAVVLPHQTVGDDVSIGAGAVVTKSIPAKSVAIGIPARVRMP
ncbi:MAG: acetyltransferase [Rubripirellula sp.]